jgi:hypothetical protein
MSDADVVARSREFATAQVLDLSSAGLWLCVRIRITKPYWEYIVRVTHREMMGLEEVVVDAFVSPFEIRRSLKDPSVHLYYGRYSGKFVCVVVKHINGDGYVVTAYVTSRVGKGEVIWRG